MQATQVPELSRVYFQGAHLEVTACTVPSNAIALRAHATVQRVHADMVAVYTDGQEKRVMKVSSKLL